MKTPSFTKEQLDWLNANVPPGPANRLFGDLTPTTDAQQVGAFALLSQEQRDQIDADNAAKAAQAKVDAAKLQVDQTVVVAQSAIEAVQGTNVDTSVLQAVVDAVQSTPDPAPAETPSGAANEPAPVETPPESSQ